jgi:hypothetical protein
MYPNNIIIYYNIKIIIPCRARAEIHGFFVIAPAAAFTHYVLVVLIPVPTMTETRDWRCRLSNHLIAVI